MHPIPLDEFGREQTCNSGGAGGHDTKSQPPPPEPLERKAASGPMEVLVGTDVSTHCNLPLFVMYGSSLRLRVATADPTDNPR